MQSLSGQVLTPASRTPAEIDKLREAGSLFSPTEINLTWIIFAFGLVTLLAYCYLVRQQNLSNQTMRIFVIIVIVFGTLLVVSSSFATQQIAPVVGLFGTIAGYLLGKGEKRDDE